MNTLFKLRNTLSPLKGDDLEIKWDEEDDEGNGGGSQEINTKGKSYIVDEDTCPICHNSDCLDFSDLVTCKECGNIVRRPFDNTAEYRFFSLDDRGGDPTRVGAPQDSRLPEASLGTLILSGHGKPKTMYRIRKYHSWNTISYKERTLIQTCERLSLIGLNYGINQSIIEDTKNMYITLQEISSRQGLSRDALLCACVYMSLKEAGTPRKPKEVAELFKLSTATFTKALKQTQEILAMARQKGMGRNNSNKPSQSSTKATEYIQLPLSRLPLQRNDMEHLTLLCVNVAKKADDIGLGQENMPPSLAAACIAFVVKRCEGLDININKISEVTGISIATLQKCLKRLEQRASEIEDAL
jgi:transcription initiation factor TFIIIB Brf1 subunit/transcription initiation factor TFIIB